MTDQKEKAATASEVPVIELRGISKNFTGVQALTAVDFELYAGQINALLGENGAGKSTLIKIIAGAHQPSGGTIILDGREVQFKNPHQAMEAGVAVVYQETSLAPDLSVLENLYLGSWKKSRGRIDWRSMRLEATELFQRLQMDIPLGVRLGSLGKASAQQVEIARALLRGARILILDEPGSVLNDNELRSLHSLLLDSKRSGVAVVYITHRLEEVFRIADRITVLRDGANAAVADAAEVDEPWVVRQMVGRDVTDLYSRTDLTLGEPLLKVSDLTDNRAFFDINFTVHAGEIVGLAGLVGAGRSELARAIAGIEPSTSGKVLLKGTPTAAAPWDRQKQGIGYLPGDRSGQGVLSFRSNIANVTLTTLSKYSRFGIMSRSAQRAGATRAMEQLNVKPLRPDLPIGALSGGNQQKVLIGRVLATDPAVLILEEPTSGVDIGAKAEIHRIVDELVSQGKGVLLISSDLPELVGMSDRTLVMREGRIVGEFGRGANHEDVMALAFKSTSNEE